MLNDLVSVAISSWRKHTYCPEDSDQIAGQIFLRLVAARTLIDKEIISANPLNLNDTILATKSLIPRFMERSSFEIIPKNVLNIMWDGLSEVSFALLTSEMLSGIYENGLLSDKSKKNNGIHYTPPSLRRFLWNMIGSYIKDIQNMMKGYAHPTCGIWKFFKSLHMKD